MKSLEGNKLKVSLIPPVPHEIARPQWSVMLPVCNRLNYLHQALASVLIQDAGTEAMQICIVDNSTEVIDWRSWLTPTEAARVEIFKQPQHVSMSENWNTCLVHSQGQWVHILHWDDYILPGFYQALGQAAELHPEVGWLAARSFFVDADGVINGVSARLKTLEQGAHIIDDFFYVSPVQCPGVVVKRSCYESLGGFELSLKFTPDLEMWARIISSAGGLVIPEVLSCYRQSGLNETARLGRTLENLRDYDRLYKIYAEKYPAFDLRKARGHQLARALQMAALYEKNRDNEAAQASWNYWKKNASLTMRLRRFAGGLKRKYFLL